MTDIKAAIWAGVELAADPQTVTAFAEVTATLCHTLEMEDSLHRRTQTAQKRRERNEFTKQAYLDPNLVEDPDVTIEQSIMSGLGGVVEETPPGGPPRNVTLQPQAVSTTGSSLESDWKQAGRDQVDSSYLEQQIRKRATQKDQERMLRTTITTTTGASVSLPTITKPDTEELRDEIEDLVVETVSDGEDEDGEFQRQKTKKSSNTEERSKQSLSYEGSSRGRQDSAFKFDTSGVTTPETSPSEDSEPAVSKFYRTLDEVLAKKRADGLDEVLKQGDALSLAKGFKLKQKTSKDHESVKGSFAALQRAARDGDVESAKKILGETDKILKKHSVPLLILSIMFLCTVVVWFGFGCYGMYVVFQSTSIGARVVPRKPPNVAKSIGGTQEIVIRVVREVVHVNQDGETIDYGKEVETPLDMEQVAECVSKIA